MTRKIAFIYKISLSLLMTLGFFGITGVSQAAVLPKAPPDFYVRLDSSSGMAPSGYYIEIDGTEGTFQESMAGDHRTVNFSLSQKELADLWAVFQKNSFRTIRTHQEKIYDRGGITLTRIANHINVTKSDSGRSIVNTGSSARRFYKIAGYIETLVGKKTQPLPVFATGTIDLL